MRRARVVLVGAVLVVVLTYGGLTVAELAGAPASAKDCAVHALPTPVAPDLARPVAEYPGELAQRGGTLNDASCLNRTPVYGVVRPRSAAEVREALAFARAEGLSVSVAGTRHSMGGQAFFPRALVLDMRGLDRVRVDPAARTATVQAGATWHEVLEAVHPHGLSVATMPSIDVLSVGGTLSVDAHGLDFRAGASRPRCAPSR